MSQGWSLGRNRRPTSTYRVSSIIHGLGSHLYAEDTQIL